MKKLLALLLCAVLCLSMAACASNTTTTETPAASTLSLIHIFVGAAHVAKTIGCLHGVKRPRADLLC